MRLINTETLELNEFFHIAWDDDSFPKYAILSHCWNADEVTYEDFVKRRRLDSLGYRKIKDCSSFALAGGFQWVWIDTW